MTEALIWLILAAEYVLLAVGFRLAWSASRDSKPLRPMTRRLRRDTQLALWISKRSDEGARIARQRLIGKYPPGWLPVPPEDDPHRQLAWGVGKEVGRD